MTQSLVIQHRRPHSLNLAHTARCLAAQAGAAFKLPAPGEGGVLRIPAPGLQRLPEAVCAELASQEADFALLEDIPFADIRLVVSDMDSTLITIECIDEIAAAQGLKDRVAEITERAMRGEMDFARSLTERTALLAGLPEAVLEEVYRERLRLTEGAEYLIGECRRHGISFVLVSGGFTYFTDRLQRRLGFQAAHANRLETAGGRLTGRIAGPIVDAQAKAALLEQYRRRLGCRPEQTVAVGDGANDIPMLRAAGFGIAFRAKPKTREAAALSISHNGLEAVRGWFL